MYTGSPPPSTHAPGGNTLGPAAGVQSRESWPADKRDERPILSAMKAPHLWRVTLHGENVTFRVSWGTSSNLVVAHVVPPARFTVPGSCDVYAVPVVADESLPAHAECTLTPATAGGDAVMRAFVVGTGQILDPNAARFVALNACVVRVGPVGASVVVNLVALQSVLLVAGSLLTSGSGYLEYEP